jgi:MFS family permease
LGYNLKSSSVLTIISITITWLITALVLLVYSFNYLDIINDQITSYIDLKTIILFLTASFAILSLLLTGYLIDKRPDLIHLIFGISLVISIISLILIGTFEDLIIGFAFVILGISLGGLTGASGAYYGGFTKRIHRGKTYSAGIALFALLSVLIIAYLNLTGVVNSTRLAMYLIALIGVIFFILFLFLNRSVKPWKNDKWPTKLKQILDRKTVQSYLLTHFILYFMIGLAIQAISATGDGLVIENEFLLKFDPVDLFWLVVFLFDFIISLGAGYIIDLRKNRKTILIVSIYIIALAILIFAIEKSLFTYLFSAGLLGISVAFIHVTIDSSIWADLSPRDALGRYFAFGFTSLILGVSLGYSFGLILNFFWITQAINIAGLVLILLAAVSMFPLFFVSDTAKPLNFSLLLAITKGGMPCFSYNFGKQVQTKIELPMLAGALQAISTFMSETIDKDSQLSLVEHGEYLIISEWDKDLTAAIFVNKGDSEIRKKLRKFIKVFMERYEKDMKEWYGDTTSFADAEDIVENVFGPLIPADDFN